MISSALALRQQFTICRNVFKHVEVFKYMVKMTMIQAIRRDEDNGGVHPYLPADNCYVCCNPSNPCQMQKRWAQVGVCTTPMVVEVAHGSRCPWHSKTVIFYARGGGRARLVGTMWWSIMCGLSLVLIIVVKHLGGRARPVSFGKL